MSLRKALSQILPLSAALPWAAVTQSGELMLTSGLSLSASDMGPPAQSPVEWDCHQVALIWLGNF